MPEKSSLDKARAARDNLKALLPQILGTASPVVASMAEFVTPLVEEWLDHELATRTAADIDELFEGVFGFFGALRSDDAPDLLIRSPGRIHVGQTVVARIAFSPDTDELDNWDGLWTDIGEPLESAQPDPLRAPVVPDRPDPVGQVDPGQGAAPVGGPPDGGAGPDGL